MAADTTTQWVPEGQLNRWNLALAGLITGWGIWTLGTQEAVAWGVAAAGFVSFAIAVGPLAASPVGARVGAWFRGIGYTGRALVIVGFAIVVWTAIPWFDVDPALPTSFSAGGMLGLGAVVLLEAVRSRLGESAS